MPKNTLMRTIDAASQNGNNGATPVGNYALMDNVDRVDGFHAFSSPRPGALLALDNSGKFPLSALPAASVGQATGHFGVQYVGPTAYLAEPLEMADESLLATAALWSLDDYAVIGWIEGNEHIKFTTGATQEGPYYRYGIQRALRTTPRRAFPAYATVVGLGAAGVGGHILFDSASDADSPLIKIRSNDADGTFHWRFQAGRLGTVPEAFRALWDEDTDWSNTWGMASENVYLSGGFHVQEATVAGDMRVEGTITVPSGKGRAGVVIGESEGGHGFVLQNKEGDPVFAAVAPYKENGEVLSDVAVYIDNKGQKGLFYHLDPVSDEYRLEIGVETLIDGQLTAANILAGTGSYPGAFTGMR